MHGLLAGVLKPNFQTYDKQIDEWRISPQSMTTARKDAVLTNELMLEDCAVSNTENADSCVP
jgi:hypothetical protein